MTKYVVDNIKLEFQTQNVQVDVYEIENTQAQSISLSDYDTVGIAYPVHSFNAPKISSFIRACFHKPVPASS